MKIKYEATCDIPDSVQDIEKFIQTALGMLVVTNVINPEVISACEIKEEPEPPKDYIEGEVCTVCGFNGKSKIIDLTDEYVLLHCPQCHSKFKVEFNPDEK